MSYTVTKYPQGTFSWADVYSTDIAKTKNFMQTLLGWTSIDVPTSPGRPDYTMFALDGQTVAGGSPVFDPQMPSFWMSYVTVDDLDAKIAQAQTLGATVKMPAMEVMDAGRMATIQDPTGAHLTLWQAKNHIGSQVVNKVGAMCWNELYTHDTAKAQEFYGQLFNWTFNVEKDMNNYISIQNNGRSNGGIFAITPEMGQMPPNWTVYFTVAGIEASIAKTTELGGQVYMPVKDIGVGKIAMIADPAGASFMVMQMIGEPEHWIE